MDNVDSVIVTVTDDSKVMSAVVVRYSIARDGVYGSNMVLVVKVCRSLSRVGLFKFLQNMFKKPD